MTDKDIYIMLRGAGWFQKNKDFIKFVKSRNPYFDVHHLLGSVTGRKYTDYLVCSLPHEEHIEKAEKQKAEYCVAYLTEAITNMIDYIELLEEKCKTLRS